MDSLKVLVVDDEARMRKLVRDFLTVKGFQVLEAEDGEKAVELFFQQKDIARQHYQKCGEFEPALEALERMGC